MLRRQRTILGSLLHDVLRKMGTLAEDARTTLETWLVRAERIQAQKLTDTSKARQPCDSGVKVTPGYHPSAWPDGGRLGVPGQPV